MRDKPMAGWSRRWFARFEWKPQDCWVGVFWKRRYPWSLDVWVCVVPMLPFHFGWMAAIQHATEGDSGLTDYRIGDDVVTPDGPGVVDAVGTDGQADLLLVTSPDGGRGQYRVEQVRPNGRLN